MNTIRAFLCGVLEFRSSFTRGFYGQQEPLQNTYDRGREWAHRLTFRKFED